MQGLDPILAHCREEAVYNLDKFPHTESQKAQSLDCGRKLEYLEDTHI